MSHKSGSDRCPRSDRPTKPSDSDSTPVDAVEQSSPEYEKLLNLYASLSEVGDPVRLQFELDRSYQIARRQCGLRSLAAFKSGFVAYLEQRKRGQ